MAEKATEKCGFVAVLGASNAGKSTLVNRVVGTKVSIVSKAQTTAPGSWVSVCGKKHKFFWWTRRAF